MHAPDPLVISIDLSLLIEEVSQENDLQEMIKQQKVLHMFQWEFRCLLVCVQVRVCEDVELVDRYQGYVHREQDGHEGEPVKVLLVVLYEIVFVFILAALYAFVISTQGASYLFLYNITCSREDIAVKAQDLYNEPAINPSKLLVL